MIARRQWFEFEDLEWFPATLRDLLTDSLQFGIRRFGFYRRALPVLGDLLRQTGARHVVDLCSGATGPWLDLIEPLRRAVDHGVAVTFTDKFINRHAQAAVDSLGDPGLRFHPSPVDAMSVPRDVAGVRTMFTSLHHFSTDAARAVLTDATRSGAPIAIFEFTERTLTSCLLAMVVPLAMLFTTPFMQPLQLRRLVFTYLVPVLPLCNLWDGVMSNLRAYTVDELRELAEPIARDSYHWTAGRIARAGGAPAITYLIGTPR